jgi:hypothetical protein
VGGGKDGRIGQREKLNCSKVIITEPLVHPLKSLKLEEPPRAVLNQGERVGCHPPESTSLDMGYSPGEGTETQARVLDMVGTGDPCT